MVGGAVLEVKEGGVAYLLQANSAVLYLLSLAGGDSGGEETWLEWEAGQLQVKKLKKFSLL